MTTRRDVLKGSLAAAGLAAFGIPEWAVPALAEGETVVPFTDIPQNFSTNPSDVVRVLDIRKIDNGPTPKDQFFTTQHYGHPNIDMAAFRLKITGLVDRPQTLSLDQIKALGHEELAAAYECSGNGRGRIQGFASNGRWTGVPLKKVLKAAGLKANGYEVVFFGADHGEEETDFRQTKVKLDQVFGRSLRREKALSDDPLVAWALDGEPLTTHQGAPLRLIVPGWYGVANVKWLSRIHVQEDPFLGKFQSRWYRTMYEQKIDGDTVWNETAVTHMRLKSIVARVTKEGSAHKVFGFVLNDGTPVKSVEVKIDNGPWQAATIQAPAGKYAWKYFTYTWNGATSGEHTVVSRATDSTGYVQPESLPEKKTFLEDNSQFPRKVMI
ncbi:MAG TPA: molybdopterin-dependent oxidoreductase [Vicinamibacterales bacterium]|nr:molybdopterin-dependent oxidoreductase [Vicinamibacterales bacterium]